MKKSKFVLLILSVFALTFTLVGCGKDDSVASDGIVNVFNSEPQKGLIPVNTIETGGGHILQTIYSGLTYIDENNKLQYDLAESISSTDDQLWTIKLKPNLSFSDGTKITSQDFVDDWNYGADADNGMGCADFFKIIKGYGKGKTLSGLKVVDERTFTVELNQQQSDFKKVLSYSGYSVFPSISLKSKEAFKQQGENPVASGPYMPKDANAWQHNVQFETVKNPNYTGPRQPQNGGIKFKIYSKDTAAYADLLSDQLDVLDTIPTADLKTYKNDLGENVLSNYGATISFFAIPEYLEHFKYNKEGLLRRKAISKAIDRQDIIDNILLGSAKTITDFIPYSIDGHSDNLKNADNAKFNAEEAKKLWAEAEKISKYTGTFYFAFNADASANQSLGEALSNSISNTLGIKAEPKPVATFAQLLDMQDSNKMDGAYRFSWQFDYPSAYNIFSSCFITGSSANQTNYTNKKFDKAAMDILTAKSDAESNQKIATAEEILLEDLPAIPLWNGNSLGGYSKNVTNVKYNWQSSIIYELIQVKG